MFSLTTTTNTTTTINASSSLLSLFELCVPNHVSKALPSLPSYTTSDTARDDNYHVIGLEKETLMLEYERILSLPDLQVATEFEHFFFGLPISDREV